MRSVLAPPNEIPLTGISVVFEEFAERAKLPFVLSASVTLNAIDPVEPSSSIVWLGIDVMVGAVFPEGGGGGGGLPASTVTRKLRLPVAWPSLTRTVMLAVPLREAVGVTVTVRFVLLPPKTMPLRGINPVFEEVAAKVRLADEVSKSKTLNAIEPVFPP